MFANKFFIIIFVICVAGQALIVNFGGAAFQVTPIDGIHWLISVAVGFLSLPIGLVIRLIPDNVFAFILVKRSARERYLGHAQKVPSMYMAGNERLSWNAKNHQDTFEEENQYTQYSYTSRSFHQHD